jgi:hypothetical protein
MALATPTVSWEAVLSQVTQDSTQYQYTCKVSKVNVNDPGYGQLAIGYYIVDHIGHIFEIKALNFNGDPEAVVVLDLLSDPYSYGPYNDKNAYVFDSLHKAALLAQAKLNRLDESAEDFVRSLGLDPKIIEVAGIDFDTTVDPFDWKEGRVFWDKSKHALAYYNDEEDITVDLGQEFLIPVYNNTGSIIANGKIVYPTGSIVPPGETEARHTIALADASKKAKCRTIAVATHDIGVNEPGYVTRLGSVGGLNTAGMSGQVYLSTDGSGDFTTALPDDGCYIVEVGAIKIEDAVNGSITVDPKSTELTVEVTDTNGFPPTQRTNTLLSFVDNGGTPETSRIFTIAATSYPFHYYDEGIKYEKEGPESIQITDVEGIHVLYYEDSVLSTIANPNDGQIDTLIRTACLIAYVYWDADNNVHTYFGDERHGISMAPDTHTYLHFTRGAQYLYGLGLGNILADENGSLSSHAQFSIEGGLTVDEDITTTLSAIASTVGLPIYYLSGANAAMRRTTQAGFSVKTTGTGRLAYNQWTGATWQLTEVTDGKYVLCHVLSVNGLAGTDQQIAIIGQAEYATSADARAAASTEIASVVTRFPFQETIAVATIIFQTKDSYTNSINARIISTAEGTDYINWLTTELSTGSAPTSHSNLTNLTADDHTQYALLAGRVGGQTLVGSPTTNEALTLQGYNKIVRRSSAFDSIWRNTGSTWADFTAAGRSVPYEAFQPLLTNTYKCYFGKITQFSKMYFYFITLAVGQTTTFEYSKGGGVWGALTVTDNTNNFTVNQSAIIFTPPLDWSTDTVNGTSGMYWVRLGSTTSSSTDANIYTVTSDGGETLFEVWHDTAETYPALGVDKNGWASIPYIKTPVIMNSTLAVGSTIQGNSYISANGSYLRSYIASTGTTYTYGVYTYGSTVATAGAPITHSTTIRMSGYAWNTTPTAASKANSMEMLIKPVSGSSTYPVWAFKNAYVDGVANNTELMWLSHLGDLKTLLSVTTPLYKLEDAGTTAIAKDGSNNMTFTDAVTGTKTLAELAAASSYVYNNATPMPEDVGGYESTTTFTNQSLDDMFDGLLYPYQYPAFNTFTIQSQTIPLEVGASIAANRTFTWTTNDAGDGKTNANIAAGSIVIRDVTGNANIATGLDYDDTPYLSSYGAITKNTATTNQFSITGTNSKSQAFNTTLKTYTVTWQWRIYYGTSASTSLDQTGIKGLLNKPLASTIFGNKSFVAGDYKYICFPATFTPPNSFKDSAGLLVAMTQLANVDVTNEVIGNPQTTAYKVYRTSYPQVAALTITIA